MASADGGEPVPLLGHDLLSRIVAAVDSGDSYRRQALICSLRLTCRTLRGIVDAQATRLEVR